MSPGPLSAHGPIDAGAAQRQRAGSAGEADADAGTSFADLLEAMLAPGCSGTPLQAPVAEEAVFETLDAAKMFNETGLFRGAAPLHSGGATPAGLSAAPAVSAAPAATPLPEFQADLRTLSASLDPAPSAPGPAATAGPGKGGPPPAYGSPAVAVAKASRGALRSLDGQPFPMSVSPVQGTGAAAEAAAGGRISARTAAMVAQLLAARAGAAAAQVTVQAIESGISVIARVDRLAREERDRLRSEIGELLARHGFANADIVMNGEAWPLPQGEEE